MDANQRIASRIIFDLEKTKANQLSLDQLEKQIEAHISALDSTFPQKLKKLIYDLVPQIHKLETFNYAANLNTDKEGEEDAGIRDSSFDKVIATLREYVSD